MDTTNYMKGRQCFAALEKHFANNPEALNLPWEYMGHNKLGHAFYRERETNTRLVLNPDGTNCGTVTKVVDL